jgi:photosystem II stability/assembly factor-like uncharacterized protein
MLMFSVALALSCDDQRSKYESHANVADIPQIRSTSIFGQERALFVHEQQRDLRVTIDGAQTWQIFPSNSVMDGFECATLTPTNRLWAVSHEGRVLTANYPEPVWTEISNLRKAASGDFSGAKQIEFVNESSGWILEFLSIWHTKDGGVTWTKTLSVSSPGVNGQPTGMFVINETTLLAIGTEGQVFLTNDSGATWQIQTIGNKPDLTDVWFSDKETGWICGYMSGRESITMVLFVTKDGGMSWSELPFRESGVLPFSVCFVENEGWISGQRSLEDGSRKTVLLHTADAGRHWAAVPVPDEDLFLGLIRFTNTSDGWLVGRDSLYRTHDGGKSWQRVLTLLPTG